jgi:hypothetical protein
MAPTQEGNIMGVDDHIYIKLEIEKDPNTGQLMILTRFDPDAPNFSQDEAGISWCPTAAEKEFINEAFGMIAKKR